jgi:hypothetical protein
MGDTWEWAGPLYRCTTALRGDINCDGTVDNDDMASVLAAQKTAACALDDPRDLDANGVVNVTDYSLIRSQCSLPGCAIP